MTCECEKTISAQKIEIDTLREKYEREKRKIAGLERQYFLLKCEKIAQEKPYKFRRLEIEAELEKLCKT